VYACASFLSGLHYVVEPPSWVVPGCRSALHRGRADASTREAIGQRTPRRGLLHCARTTHFNRRNRCTAKVNAACAALAGNRAALMLLFRLESTACAVHELSLSHPSTISPIFKLTTFHATSTAPACACARAHACTCDQTSDASKGASPRNVENAFERKLMVGKRGKLC